jgi:hypothetical protein
MSPLSNKSPPLLRASGFCRPLFVRAKNPPKDDIDIDVDVAGQPQHRLQVRLQVLDSRTPEHTAATASIAADANDQDDSVVYLSSASGLRRASLVVGSLVCLQYQPGGIRDGVVVASLVHFTLGRGKSWMYRRGVSLRSRRQCHENCQYTYTSRPRDCLQSQSGETVIIESNNVNVESFNSASDQSNLAVLETTVVIHTNDNYTCRRSRRCLLLALSSIRKSIATGDSSAWCW